MSAITDLIGGIVSGLGDTALKIRTAITGIDPAKQAEVTELTLNIQAKAAELAAGAEKAQTDLDAQYAGLTGTNFFKFWCAGPRPFILWVCGLAFLLQYVVQPYGNAWFGLHLAVVDMGIPTQVVLGALGLGNIVTRTVEKIQGAAGNH